MVRGTLRRGCALFGSYTAASACFVQHGTDPVGYLPKAEKWTDRVEKRKKSKCQPHLMPDDIAVGGFAGHALVLKTEGA